ncbi:hypothetical protein [Halorussus sp. MSC15.2]|uniref:hypothetical protein n=1 Tax=Halorussus sp. MSC15.2 TaxID=2283638 RepID=UPI0013D868AF|nr:hypothetical protein [Halorussus sp. MSC15.2]NEU56952.1 hypothetical protein [Halorussus sp. MSC15.2]
MSTSRLDGEQVPDERDTPFRDRLESTEEIRLSWTGSDVRWVNQWRMASDSPTAFAATDRRVLFETGETTASIGYNHVRAVKIDPAGERLDLSTAFLACGGLCLVVGLLAAINDVTSGVALILLAVMLLLAGNAVETGPDCATVTVVIDNERQRLSFSAREEVGEELAELAEAV